MTENAPDISRQIEDAAAAYSATFGQLELSNPVLLTSQPWLDLLRRAVARGTPITQDEIERECGPIPWEW